MTRYGLSLLAALLGAAATLADDPVEVDLLKLTTIDYKEGEPLPDDIQELDGKRVVITGYMGPYTEEGTHVFQLITDQCGCNGTPKVFHFVRVDLGEQTTGFRPGQVKVAGTLSVGEEREDGYVISVYRLAAESLE